MTFNKEEVLEFREKQLKGIIKALKELGWDSFDINMVVFGYLSGLRESLNSEYDVE